MAYACMVYVVVAYAAMACTVTACIVLAYEATAGVFTAFLDPGLEQRLRSIVEACAPAGILDAAN